MPLFWMRERMDTLDRLINGLCRMRSELSTYGISISDLMGLMKAEEMFSMVAECLEKSGPMAFSDSWKSNMKSFGNALTVRELHALEGLGEILGRYALEEQIESLNAVLELLTEGMNETKHKLKSVSRLYVGTSLSLSAMLVVLLI